MEKSLRPTNSHRILGIIPVRLNSTRLPNKALIDIAGKPLIVHTYLNAKSLVKKGLLNELFIATDSKEIAKVIEKIDAESQIIFTPSRCQNGTDRIVSALKKIPKKIDAKRELIVNIQGDEPMFSAKNLKKLIDSHLISLKKNAQYIPDLSTLATPIAKEKAIDPNVVKAVINKQGRAIYFSRALVPHNRDEEKQITYLKHLGIYAYSRHFLEEKLGKMPLTALEKIEKIEQLRFLAAGCAIAVGVVKDGGVDINVAKDIDLFLKALKLKLKPRK